MDPITALMTGSEIAGAGKKTKKNITDEMSSNINKYDAILGNKVTKAPASGGQVNAINSNPMFRNASEELDFLYKLAGEKESDFYPYRERKRDNRNRRPNNNFRALTDYPNQEINLREIRENGDNQKINPYALAGGSVLGAAALQALLMKDPKAPIQSISRGTNLFIHKLPKKVLGKNKNAKNMIDIIRTGTKPYQKRGTKNGAKTFNESKVFNEAAQKNVKPDIDTLVEAEKEASQLIDELFYKQANLQTKVEEVAASPKMQKARRMIRDDFFRSGIESVPYYAAPAALGYVTGKNLSHPEDDPNVTRVIVDVPLENLQDKMSKKAAEAATEIGQAIANAKTDMSWKEWATEQLPKRTIQGLGRAVFPAIVIGVTGRNIKGRLEKLEKNDKNGDGVKDGTARITIETKPPVIKKASEELDVLCKEASSALTDTVEKLKSIDLSEQTKKELQKTKNLTNFNNLKMGVTKQYRTMK
jgi:hypothetical protein